MAQDTFLQDMQKLLHGDYYEKKFKLKDNQTIWLQKETRLTRTRLFARFFRLPRLVKIFPFYEKPIKKEIKFLEKDVEKIEKGLKKKLKTKL